MKANVASWLPIIVLPGAVIVLTPTNWPAWAFMWPLAFTIYAACKWLTWCAAHAGSAPWWRHVGYLLFWPGLDADTFLFSTEQKRPSPPEWLFAFAKFGIGLALLMSVAQSVPVDEVILRGWIAIVGIAFVLHFGLFHMLSVLWRAFGVDAKPLMNWPMLASSVSDFWGRRWNTAFRDLTHRFLFRPLTARFGPKMALAIGFLFSGIVHDLVISLPARGGYGGPTVFFLLQALAIFVERSAVGKRIGLGRGIRGWLFAMVVLLGPLGLLFHPPFLRDVVVPFVEALHY